MNEMNSHMNFEIARHNMIEQQIRPWNVLDQKSLEILQDIPREEFVPKAYKQLAFSDMQIPLGSGQFMLEPKIEAHILQAVQIQSNENVLEVGTGSGYLTAVLAKKARQVTSIEIDSELAAQARENLEPFNLNNISIEIRDAAQSYVSHSIFNVIIISGGLYEAPEAYKNLLTTGGRLFVITGEGPVMTARLLTRVADDQWSDVELFETEIDYLVNAEKESSFEF